MFMTAYSVCSHLHSIYGGGPQRISVMTKPLILGAARYEQRNVRAHLDTGITVFEIVMGMEQTMRATVSPTLARLRLPLVVLVASGRIDAKTCLG
jgi:hypothetical protein